MPAVPVIWISGQSARREVSVGGQQKAAGARDGIGLCVPVSQLRMPVFLTVDPIIWYGSRWC